MNKSEKMNFLFIIITLAMVFIGSSSVYALEEYQGNLEISSPLNITTNSSVTGDWNVTFNSPIPENYDNLMAIKVNGTKTLSSSSGSTIKVDVVLERNPSTAYEGTVSGIYAEYGTVDFSKSKVIINGAYYGAYVFDGVIKLGDNSEITADLNYGGEAICSSGSEGLIEVGDNAVIVGVNSNGSGGAVSSWYGGEVIIGNSAKITNDGSNTLGYPHSSIYAAYGGIVTIGEDSLITNLFPNDSALAFLVNTGYYDGQTSNVVNIGDRARLINESKTTSAGVYIGQNGNVTIGKDSLIQMKYASQYGLYFTKVGTVELGENSVIQLDGASSIGIFFSGAGSANLQDKTKIQLMGDNSVGVYYLGGGEVTFGDKSQIDVNGENSTAFMVFHANLATLTATDLTKSFEGIVVNNESSNLVVAATGKAVELIFKDSTLQGDALATGYKYTLGDEPSYATEKVDLVLEGSSTWEGSKAASSYYQFDNMIPSKNLTFEDVINDVNLYLNDTSKWLIGKDSAVDILNMNDSTTAIEFLHKSGSEEFYTANVKSIDGSGMFILNVDMHLGKGDFLKAEEISGTAFKLKIKPSNSGDTQQLQLLDFDVYNLADGSSIALVNDNNEQVSNIQIGAYSYELQSKNNFLEWWLVRGELDTKVLEESGDSILGKREFAKAIDATLSDEIMKRKNKLWTVAFYAWQNYDENVLNTSMNQHLGGGIMGIDNKFNDKVSAGIFFGLGLAYQNIGDNSKGHISSLTAGAYAKYDSKYLDVSGYIRAANYSNDLILIGSSGNSINATLNTHGFSASIQAATLFELTSKIYVEPKVKTTYTYILGQTYDVGGLKFETASMHGVTTWLGAKIGIKTINTESNSYKYYLEAGWVHDINPEVTYYTTDSKDENNISLGKNRFEAGIGINVALLEKSSISIEAKYSRGNGMVQPIKLVFEGSCYF